MIAWDSAYRTHAHLFQNLQNKVIKSRNNRKSNKLTQTSLNIQQTFALQSIKQQYSYLQNLYFQSKSIPREKLYLYGYCDL